MSNKLINLIADLDEESAISLAKEQLEAGADPYELLNLGVAAMGMVGDRFSAGEYFLPELLMAGEIMEAINQLVLPLMADEEIQTKKAKIVLGTVSGDTHDIGKNIVRFMLEANGYSVIDLGTDVPADKFVESVKTSGASIVGLSALLTLSYDSMRATVGALRSAGLRDQVKVMIGGAPVDEKVLEHVGADALGKTAVAAVDLANGWVAEKES